MYTGLNRLVEVDRVLSDIRKSCIGPVEGIQIINNDW